MLSDEEKKAIENVEKFVYSILNGISAYDCKVVLNLIEKQSKEIEELKEDRKKYAEEYIHNNPWLYKQLNENYILRVESEQKERKAWIKGTNDAYELCNKKWKDKIKAKIEEYDDKGMTVNLANRSAGKTFQQAVHYEVKAVLQSLLEKE